MSFERVKLKLNGKQFSCHWSAIPLLCSIPQSAISKMLKTERQVMILMYGVTGNWTHFQFEVLMNELFTSEQKESKTDCFGNWSGELFPDYQNVKSSGIERF